MKALDLLKNNMVIRKAVEPNYLNEAINELEELENRKCINCNNFKIFNSKVVRDSCSILNVSDIGGCGDYFEPKESNEFIR